MARVVWIFDIGCHFEMELLIDAYGGGDVSTSNGLGSIYLFVASFVPGLTSCRNRSRAGIDNHLNCKGIGRVGREGV